MLIGYLPFEVILWPTFKNSVFITVHKRCGMHDKRCGMHDHSVYDVVSAKSNFATHELRAVV